MVSRQIRAGGWANSRRSSPAARSQSVMPGSCRTRRTTAQRWSAARMSAAKVLVYTGEVDGAVCRWRLVQVRKPRITVRLPGQSGGAQEGSCGGDLCGEPGAFVQGFGGRGVAGPGAPPLGPRFEGGHVRGVGPVHAARPAPGRSARASAAACQRDSASCCSATSRSRWSRSAGATATIIVCPMPTSSPDRRSRPVCLMDRFRDRRRLGRA